MGDPLNIEINAVLNALEAEADNRALAGELRLSGVLLMARQTIRALNTRVQDLGGQVEALTKDDDGQDP